MKRRLSVWLLAVVATLTAGVLVAAPAASADYEELSNPSQANTFECEGARVYIQIGWDAYDTVTFYWRLRDSAANGKTPILRIKAEGPDGSVSNVFRNDETYIKATGGVDALMVGRKNDWDPSQIGSINHLRLRITDGTSDQGVGCDTEKLIYNWAMNGLHNARNEIGDRYVWGAEGPDAFDCSGLVYYSYNRIKNFGTMPVRSSDAMFNNSSADDAVGKYYYRRIASSNKRPGDLVFYDFNSDGVISHVGIYVGGGRILDAGGQGIPVGYHNDYTAGRSYYVRLLGVETA